MDVDAVIRREPELALVDELAHTNAPGMRNEKRYQDIDEMLDAGIDVISTVNVQHLESLNDAVFELTGVRVRETFPDRILDEADEVVLVDLSPEALQERLRAGQGLPRRAGRGRARRTSSGIDNLAALRELVLRELAEDVEARRQPTVLDPLSQQAVAERILALVEPEPQSQRILRRAWRSAQRLGAEIDALWMRPPGREPTRRGGDALAALRRARRASSAIHFLEVEGDDLVDDRSPRRRASAARRTSSSARPTSRGAREILRGSLALAARARAARASTSASSPTARCARRSR